MKQIVIFDCKYCPYRRWACATGHIRDLCVYRETKELMVDYKEKFPDWCELEDYEE